VALSGNQIITTLSEPASNVAAITPNDSSLLTNGSKTYTARALRCSADMTLAVVTAGGDTVTLPFFKGDNAIMVRQVLLTGTVLGGGTVWGLY
jgi:hypothetical protein